jgi:hypothetical protein
VSPGRRIAWVVIALAALQIATSLSAIGLFGRMSPAIQRILLENAVSLTAAEEMAVALAETSDDTTARRRFDAALSRARANVTEPEEPALLATLAASSGPAFAGDADARRRTLDAIAALGRVNREAMARADSEARRLGRAGAWAMTLLGLLGLAGAVLAVRRMGREVLTPLAEVAAVLDAEARGDHRRRCSVAAASGEMRRLLEGVNALADRAGAKPPGI